MQKELILQPKHSVTLYIERNKYRLFSASNLSYNNKILNENETLQCVHTVVAKNIHDKSILKKAEI